MRNSSGEWIDDFSGSCGIASNFYAELMAISNGLEIVWSACFMSLVLESNSKTTLDMNMKEGHYFHPYALLINHICRYISLDWRLVFNHTLSEGNECADCLAKARASSDQALRIWPQCHLVLNYVMLANALGFVKLRP